MRNMLVQSRACWLWLWTKNHLCES